MSRAKPHCRISLQRLRLKDVASFGPGSRGRAPGILRSLLSLYCSNSRRMVQPFPSLPPLCAGDTMGLAFASVRLCECGPRTITSMKSAGDYRLSTIPAKAAASQGSHPFLADVSMVPPPTAVSRKPYGFKNGAETSHYSRASAQSSLQRCIRAEARRGSFPPSFSLTLRSPRLRGPRRAYQTGPP